MSIAQCTRRTPVRDDGDLLGRVVHQLETTGCRAWLIVNGPYLEPTQGRQAWRIMEVDESGAPTGLVAQMYDESILLFHFPA